MYSVTQFIGTLFVGTISDYVGRKLTLIICNIGIGAFNFALGFTTNIPLLIICRMGTGLFASMSTICMAFTADTTPPGSKRTMWFGWFGACLALGIIIGPIIGGVLADYRIIVPCSVSGGMVVVSLFLVVFVVRESLPKEKRKKVPCLRSKEEKINNIQIEQKQGNEQIKDQQSTSSSSQQQQSQIQSSSELIHTSSSSSHEQQSNQIENISHVEQNISQSSNQQQQLNQQLAQNIDQQPESKPESQINQQNEPQPNPKQQSKSKPDQDSIFSVLKQFKFLLVMLNYFTSTAQFAGFQTLLPPICLDRYQYPAKMIGFITMCFGIGMAVVQLILFPIIVSRVGERRPLVFGAIFASVMMSLIALIHSKILLWIFALFFGIGQAFVVPTSTSIFSYFGSGKIKGTVLSMGQCISVAARAIAPVTLSWLYDINEQLPFYVVSGLTVAGASGLLCVQLDGEKEAILKKREDRQNRKKLKMEKKQIEQKKKGQLVNEEEGVKLIQNGSKLRNNDDSDDQGFTIPIQEKDKVNNEISISSDNSSHNQKYKEINSINKINNTIEELINDYEEDDDNEEYEIDKWYQQSSQSHYLRNDSFVEWRKKMKQFGYTGDNVDMNDISVVDNERRRRKNNTLSDNSIEMEEINDKLNQTLKQTLSQIETQPITQIYSLTAPKLFNSSQKSQLNRSNKIQSKQNNRQNNKQNEDSDSDGGFDVYDLETEY